MKEIICFKPRRLTEISGSIYLRIPKEWVFTHGLENHKTVLLSIDDEGRLIVIPMPIEALKDNGKDN